MRIIQLYVLHIWIYGCFSEGPCHTQCKCKGTGSNFKLDCSGKSWIYFPQLPEISVSVGKIDLKQNNIKHLPHGEAGTGQRPNVWSIDISENKIIIVEENTFLNMFPNLVFLDLSTNRIKQIKQKAFFGLKLLRGLYLGGNQISFISEDAFDNLMNLSHLNLASNQLQVLDFRWFKYLKSLSSLHLEFNKIKRVKLRIHHWPSSLKRVSLNNNKIPVMLPIPKHAEMFNLEGNPTYCGCRPEKLDLNEILNLTLCEVKLPCYSIELDSVCQNKQLPEESYKFWKELVAKPICQAPAIKEFSYVRNQEGLFYLTCIATGVPAPNITLYSSDTDQKIQVYGLQNTNYTSATVNQLYSGRYHCKASNIVDEMTRNFTVDLNELETTDDCYSFNLSSTSELPALHTTKGSKSKYSIYTDSSGSLSYML